MRGHLEKLRSAITIPKSVTSYCFKCKPTVPHHWKILQTEGHPNLYYKLHKLLVINDKYSNRKKFW